MIVTSEPKRLKIEANSAPMMPPPRITSRRGTSVCASRPVESTQRSDSRPGIGGRIGNEPGRDDRRLEVDVLAALDRDRVRARELAVALDPLDAVGLEEPGDAARHLLDDAGLPLVGGGEIELRRLDRDAELRERVVRLVEEVRGLHPGLGRDAPDAQAGAAELGLLLDARDLRAQLGGADRCGVAAGATAQNCDIDIHEAIVPPRYGTMTILPNLPPAANRS